MHGHLYSALCICALEVGLMYHSAIPSSLSLILIASNVPDLITPLTIAVMSHK